MSTALVTYSDATDSYWISNFKSRPIGALIKTRGGKQCKNIIVGFQWSPSPLAKGALPSILSGYAPLCFSYYVKLVLYSPLGYSKTLGAIGKSIILQPPRVPLSDRARSEVSRADCNLAQEDWRKAKGRWDKRGKEKKIRALVLSSFSTWLMLEVDNCLIYEFYNVVKFLPSSLILAELFIKAELVCVWSERKGGRWSPE